MAGRGTAPLPKGPELGGIRHLFSLGRPRLNGGPARDSRPIHRSARDETHVTLAEVLRLGAERFRQSLDACGVSVKETGHGKSSYGARDSLWRVIAPSKRAPGRPRKALVSGGSSRGATARILRGGLGSVPSGLRPLPRCGYCANASCAKRSRRLRPRR